MSTIQIGVDLAKSVFEGAISHAPGVVQSRRRLSRAAFPRFLAGQAPAEVLLEACGSAHHWGREARRCGHQVTLLHPADVARYRDGNKTDRADATALLEAARNQALSPVPVKSVEQQAVVALHRIRQAYLQTRTARSNAVRGHLRHLGAITKHGNTYLRMLLIHGARSALRAGIASKHPDDLRAWANEVSIRHGHNVAAVALANKIARVCWRTWRDGRDFERRAPREEGRTMNG